MNTHNCRPNSVNMGKFTFDISDINPNVSYIRREPTKDDYEHFLKTNRDILTTGKESLDLFLAMILIAYVFGFRRLIDGGQDLQYIFYIVIFLAPSFILHELAHKYAAIKYGKYARFTMMKNTALLTLFMGTIGILFAAPGATVILGKSTKRENGIFAAAGPMINFGIAFITFIIFLSFPEVYFKTTTLQTLLILNIEINAFLGAFNMLPFGPLDGKKVMDWNSLIWLAIIVANAMMLIYVYNLGV